MNIIYSLHKCWCDKIFEGIKTIEFRTKLPKKLKSGTILYLYETAKNGGCQKIVGQCEVDYVIPVLSKDGEWPIIGCYPFMEYFYRNIKKDEDTAEYFKKLKEEFDTYENYRYGFILNYSHSNDELESLRKTGTLLDYWKVNNLTIINRISKDREESEKYTTECDNWLESIGFYNEFGETNYQYGIVLKNIQKYKIPLSLSQFKDKNGVFIKKPPQSYVYAEKI